MLRSLRPAIVMVALFTLLLGFGYPLTVTGAAQALFPGQANGSLVRGSDGQVVGSALVGQPFAEARYLHPRPSAAGDGYDASASSGSNLGPLNEDLKARVAESAVAIRAESFGLEETPGTLVAATRTHYTLERGSERTGTVHVHFPRIGYVLKKAEA